MQILSIQNLTKTFESEKGIISVLDNISLEIEKGDIFGVIGLSGVGKSTLVRCINLLEKANSGVINYTRYINDKIKDTVDISILSNEELRNYRKEVSMIFQDFNLLNQKTVFENIEFPLTLSKGYKRNQEAINKIERLLKLVGLENKKKALVKFG